MKRKIQNSDVDYIIRKFLDALVDSSVPEILRMINTIETMICNPQNCDCTYDLRSIYSAMITESAKCSKYKEIFSAM